MSGAPDIRALADRLGCTFHDLSLLERALTHPSWAAENDGEDYQLLEFLGDSVLGFVVAQMLFRRFGQLSEGDLTRMKNSLVRGEVLADLAVETGIAELIRVGHGSSRTGVRERRSVREAAFEAVVAAVYLDAGIDAAERFVTGAMSDRIDADRLCGTTDDPKSVLQELAQSEGLGLPSYRMVSREGPPHAPSFTAEVSVAGSVSGSGNGPTKQAAEQAAAKRALEALSAPPSRKKRPRAR